MKLGKTEYESVLQMHVVQKKTFLQDFLEILEKCFLVTGRIYIKYKRTDYEHMLVCTFYTKK